MLRKDFLWGGATAANQCEGGYNEGGRGSSIKKTLNYLLKWGLKHLDYR